MAARMEMLAITTSSSNQRKAIPLVFGIGEAILKVHIHFSFVKWSLPIPDQGGAEELETICSLYIGPFLIVQ
jgi:hypothetical protein